MKNKLKIIYLIVAVLLVIAVASVVAFVNPKIADKTKKNTVDTKSEPVQQIEVVEDIKTWADGDNGETVVSVQEADKTETSEKEVSAEKSEIEKSKTITFNGKTYALNFIEVDAKKEGNHSKLVYEMANEASVKFDFETNKLVYFRNLKPADFDKNSTHISDKEAESIAKKIVAEQCDLSQYTLDRVYYNSSMGIFVDFSRHICGYKTLDNISILLEGDGDLRWFISNPFEFDGIDTAKISIDDEKILRKLDESINSNAKEPISYEITDKILCVSEEKKLQMQIHISEKTGIDGKEFSASLVHYIDID